MSGELITRLRPNIVVVELRQHGFAAEVREGCPFVPESVVPTPNAKVKLLEVLREMGYGAHVIRDGVIVTRFQRDDDE